MSSLRLITEKVLIDRYYIISNVYNISLYINTRKRHKLFDFFQFTYLFYYSFIFAILLWHFYLPFLL